MQNCYNRCKKKDEQQTFVLTFFKQNPSQKQVVSFRFLNDKRCTGEEVCVFF